VFDFLFFLKYIEGSCLIRHLTGNHRHDPKPATNRAERHLMTRKSTDSLTETQKAILQVILQNKARSGIVPSMREIAEGVGLSSVASVSYQLDNLEEKGYIRRQDNLSRNVEVLISPEGWDDANSDEADSSIPMAATAMVPMVGSIAAGYPITADQNVEEIFPLPKSLVGSGELFMLKVKGPSMEEAAICDGDWVVVRQQKNANNGDIVAALLDGEATVKTFRNRDGQVWLLPQNRNYEPIDGTHAEIMGIVVTVLRKV
jgi:repressor LexA